MKHEVKENKTLIGVLVALVVVIIGLSVAIIVVKNGRSDGDGVVEVEKDDDADEDSEMSEEEKAEIAKLEASEAVMMEKVEQVEQEAERLINETPVDTARINALYDEAMEFARQNERKDYVDAFIFSRDELYYKKGMYREELDAFLTVNFDEFSDTLKYLYYTRIIYLAEMVGDEKIKNEYEALREPFVDWYNERLEWDEKEARQLEAELDRLYGKERDRSEVDSINVDEENENE